jgi:PAS domain S-box-containing protein
MTIPLVAETEAERIGRLYAALSRINQAIVRLPSGDELFARVCQILVEDGGFTMAWIGWQDPGTRMIEPAAKWGDTGGYVDSITIASDDRPHGRGPTGTAFRTGQSYICNDMQTDPAMAPWRESALAQGYRSSAVFPIRRSGEVLGTLSVYSDQAHFFQDRETALLTEAAVDVSFALDNLARQDARLLAEEALRDSEQRFRTTFEQAAVGIGHLTLEGDFLRVNDRLCQITGYPRDELMRQKYSELAVPEDRDPTDQLTDGLLASIERGIPLERRFRHKDGSTYTASIAADLIRDPEGEPRYFVAVVTDITLRKEDETALQRSEARYHSLFEHMLEGYAYCQAVFEDDQVCDYRFLEVNTSFGRLTGLHEVVGKLASETNPELLSPDGTLMQMYDRVTRTGIAERAEFVLAPLEVWLAMSVYSIDREHFVVVFDDITERKLSDLKIAEQAGLLDQARDGIFVHDLEHRISYWSKGAERIFGWTAAEVLGGLADELLLPDLEAFQVARATVLATGAWTGEITKVTKVGGAITVESRWTLVRDGSGEPKSILVIDTDITDRKKLEVQFLRAQRMESIGTLAGGIAHDLNNVFAPIIMSLELLKADCPDPESLELIEVVSSSAQRGADMVKQVLQFARGVDGRRMAVEVMQLIRDVEKIARDTFLKTIEVRSSIPDHLPPVLGDPTQLHQVLMNLCVNARDAMPTGGVLTLSAEGVTLDSHYAAFDPEVEAGDYVLVQVEDNGSGMPPETIEKIFDPFFTTKEIGKGTGLGLSTSLAIVKSHGGFLRVYSELGKGTKFKVYFPAHVALPAEKAEEVAMTLPRGDGELVLVVDDEAAVREVTRQTLEAFGYQVLLAGDGAEAVAMFAGRKDDIAVVLTDMMMPVMDGPTTIQVLRRLQPTVRIIAASGLNANGNVGHAARLGVKHFLPKPYTAQTLLTVLRETLSQE